METWYELLGGAEAIRSLVDRFYDLMDALPELRELRAMHAPDLASARDKLYRFLVGWTGGPPLFVERYGPPRLRARHLPFTIDERMRQQWMRAMSQAIAEVVPDAALRRRLVAAFDRMAAHMRNVEDGA